MSSGSPTGFAETAGCQFVVKVSPTVLDSLSSCVQENSQIIQTYITENNWSSEIWVGCERILVSQDMMRELISDGPAKQQSSFLGSSVFSDELRGGRNSQIYNMVLRVTCNIGPGAGSHQGYIPSWECIPWVNQAFLHCLQCHTCATDTKTEGHTKKSRLQNSQIQISFHLHQSLGFQSLPQRKSLPVLRRSCFLSKSCCKFPGFWYSFPKQKNQAEDQHQLVRLFVDKMMQSRY